MIIEEKISHYINSSHHINVPDRGHRSLLLFCNIQVLCCLCSCEVPFGVLKVSAGAIYSRADSKHLEENVDLL